MKIDGLPVTNAKAPLVISITERDCSEGSTKDPTCCAAALCCARLPKVEGVRIHIGRVYLLIYGKWVRYLTPKSLRTEIIAFDRGGKFAPGEYQLAPMQPAKSTGRRQGSNKPSKRNGKTRMPGHRVTGIRSQGRHGVVAPDLPPKPNKANRFYKSEFKPT